MPSRTIKVGTIVWALLIGTGVVILGASILLPSTKRARLEFHHPEQEREAEVATTTAPAQR
jgi:hypothetical protein